MENVQNKTQKFKHCEICNKQIRRSPFTKHLKSKLHLHNVGAVLPPEAGPPEPVQQQAQPVPTLKKLARAKINLSNKELGKILSKTR